MKALYAGVLMISSLTPVVVTMGPHLCRTPVVSCKRGTGNLSSQHCCRGRKICALEHLIFSVRGPVVSQHKCAVSEVVESNGGKSMFYTCRGIVCLAPGVVE